MEMELFENNQLEYLSRGISCQRCMDLEKLLEDLRHETKAVISSTKTMKKEYETILRHNKLLSENQSKLFGEDAVIGELMDMIEKLKRESASTRLLKSQYDNLVFKLRREIIMLKREVVGMKTENHASRAKLITGTNQHRKLDNDLSDSYLSDDDLVKELENAMNN